MSPSSLRPCSCSWHAPRAWAKTTQHRTACRPVSRWAICFPYRGDSFSLPNLLVILYEGINPQRLIYLDGRKHILEQPAWLGYSVGKWEGDTLVVDTRGFNDRTWLDAFGHPHTEALHVVERFTRRDFGHIDVQMTFEDPGAYTKPFSIRFTQTLTPDTDVIEAICAENEKDRQHLDAR